MKYLFLGLFISLPILAEENRLNVQLSHSENNIGEVTYWADATHVLPGVPGCIRFQFSPPPPYRKSGLDHTVDQSRVSAKYIKKYPLHSTTQISVYAKDICTGVSGGDSRFIIIP